MTVRRTTKIKLNEGLEMFKTPKLQKSSKCFIGASPIRDIDTSADGLETFEQFFENIPYNNKMAFVMIRHLDFLYIGGNYDKYGLQIRSGKPSP